MAGRRRSVGSQRRAHDRHFSRQTPPSTLTERDRQLAQRDGPRFDVLGEGRGGPSNPRAVGVEAACAALEEAIGAAFQDAQIAPHTIGRCVIGLAGSADPNVHASLQKWVVDHQVADTFRIVPDFELVLAAGTPDDVGIGLIAGTGSLVFGRNAKGETARAGGWGYLLGDNGSGFAIGREAVRALLKRADEGTRGGPFDRRLLQHFQASTPPDVVSAVYAATDPRAALAEVAPLVLQLAEEKDDTSHRIVAGAAHDLAELVVTVARRLGMGRGRLQLAGTGGVLLGSRTLRDKLQDALHHNDIETEFNLVPTPVAGAAALALRLSRGSS